MNFNEVIKANKQNIKNIIRLITKEDNEELEQEVYCKVWKNSDKYTEKGSIKSWIAQITKNTSLDYLKSSYHKLSDLYSKMNIYTHHHQDLSSQYLLYYHT